MSAQQASQQKSGRCVTALQRRPEVLEATLQGWGTTKEIHSLSNCNTDLAQSLRRRNIALFGLPEDHADCSSCHAAALWQQPLSTVPAVFHWAVMHPLRLGRPNANRP